MVFSDSIWQDCQNIGRSTGAYIVFYQGWTIDYFIHVTCLVAQSSAESKYNIVFTTWMPLAHSMMLNNSLLNKDPDLVS